LVQELPFYLVINNTIKYSQQIIKITFKSYPVYNIFPTNILRLATASKTTPVSSGAFYSCSCVSPT
jgi:hypothetical protein